MSYGSTKNFNACELTTVGSTETPANEGEGGVAVTHTKHCTRPFCISTLQATGQVQNWEGTWKQVLKQLMFQWSEAIG